MKNTMKKLSAFSVAALMGILLTHQCNPPRSAYAPPTIVSPLIVTNVPDQSPSPPSIDNLVDAEPVPATNETNTLNCESALPREVAFSPYDIEDFMEKGFPDGKSAKEFLCPFGVGVYWDWNWWDWENSGQKIRIDSFPVWFGNEKRPGVVIRLCANESTIQSACFLVFRSSNQNGQKSWRFLGTFYGCSRIGPPSFEMRWLGRHQWFVVSFSNGPASGFYRLEEVWHAVTETGIKTVLSYISEIGIFYFPLLAFESEGELVDFHERSGTITATVEFREKYQQLGPPNVPDLDLWTKTRRATFVKRIGDKQFRLDPKASTTTKPELDVLYSYDDQTYEAFMNHNFEELMVIAKQGSTERKAWLRSFLGSLGDDADPMKKARLLEVLGREWGQKRKARRLGFHPRPPRFRSLTTGH